MSQIFNFSLLINNHNKRNFSNFINSRNFFKFYFIKNYMFNIKPFFFLNSFNYCGFLGIETCCNYSYFIPPIFLMFFEHFLIMLHWSLARCTPCCPKVNKKHLPRRMLNCYYFFLFFFLFLFFLLFLFFSIFFCCFPFLWNRNFVAFNRKKWIANCNFYLSIKTI